MFPPLTKQIRAIEKQENAKNWEIVSLHQAPLKVWNILNSIYFPDPEFI